MCRLSEQQANAAEESWSSVTKHDFKIQNVFKNYYRLMFTTDSTDVKTEIHEEK